MSSLVPEGWVSTTIGEATSEISDGGTPATSNAEYFNGSIPWVVIDDIQTRIVHTKSSITELGLQKSSAKLWDKGTIILSTGATIGEVGIAMKAMATKQGICGVVVKSDVSAKYFYHLLVSKKRQLNTLSQGSTIKETRPPTVKKIEICLPPLPEQKKIASILTSVDEVIENTQKQIDKLQDLKKATMNELLTKGIGHTEFKDSELGRIPKSWDVQSLGELSTKVGSGVTPRGGASVYQDHGIIFIRSQNVHFGGLMLDEVAYISEQIHTAMRGSTVYGGDVLLNITGASIGRCTIVPNDFPESNVNQHVCIIRPKNSLCNNFLGIWLSSEYGQDQIMRFQAGGNREGLNFEQIRSIQIPVPLIQEQEKTSEVVNSIQVSISEVQSKLSQIQSLKKSLMQDLLTGKVRVTVN